jgi:hypothetical protein
MIATGAGHPHRSIRPSWRIGMRQLWRTAIRGALLGMGLISTVLLMPAHACAVCGGSEENGYFWGVLFLMSMPFAIGSFVGGWLLYNYRRAKAGLTTSAPTLTVEGRTPRPASASSRPPTPSSPARGEGSGGGELTVRRA